MWFIDRQLRAVHGLFQRLRGERHGHHEGNGHDLNGRPGMRRLRFPHPIALLAGCILLGAALSYVLPAGEYERREDAVTGRSVVIPGTYHVVESTPVGFFGALVAIPRGMADRTDVIFLIFLIGGAFSIVDETGALRSGVAWLVARLRNRGVLVIPAVSLAFATGGVIANMRGRDHRTDPDAPHPDLTPGIRSPDRNLDERRSGNGRFGLQSHQPVPGGHRAKYGRPSALLWRALSAGFARTCTHAVDFRHHAPCSANANRTGGDGEPGSGRRSHQGQPRGHPLARPRHLRCHGVRDHAPGVGLRSDVSPLLHDGRGGRPHRGTPHHGHGGGVR